MSVPISSEEGFRTETKAAQLKALGKACVLLFVMMTGRLLSQ